MIAQEDHPLSELLQDLCIAQAGLFRDLVVSIQKGEAKLLNRLGLKIDENNVQLRRSQLNKTSIEELFITTLQLQNEAKSNYRHKLELFQCQPFAPPKFKPQSPRNRMSDLLLSATQCPCISLESLLTFACQLRDMKVGAETFEECMYTHLREQSLSVSASALQILADFSNQSGIT